MVNTPLDMKYVYKRERCLEARKGVSENATSLPDLSTITSKELYAQRVESFIKECTSYKNALSLLETLYNDNRFDLLERCTLRMINDIIPTIPNEYLKECMNDITHSNIGDSNKIRLIETTNIYRRVDRIRKNHRNLNRRFSSLNETFKTKSVRDKCFAICEMIMTYDLSRFIKFNIALEELTYIGYINGKSIPSDVVVENVSDYFLMIDENTVEDIDSYRKAIEESHVINESAADRVPYIMNSPNTESTYWVDRIQSWKMSPSKSINTLIELTHDNLGDMNALNSIISTINEFSRINEIEFDTMSIFDDVNEFTSTEARNIISIIESNDTTDTDELMFNLRSIWEADTNDLVYDDGKDHHETFSSNDIDKFKMHNLIVDAQSVGELLDRMEKTTMKESPIKIDKVVRASDTDINESNLINHIDASGYINMNIRTYLFEGSVEDLNTMLSSGIKCMNNILFGRDSVAYYTLGEHEFSIGMRSKYDVVLTEAQEFYRGFSESDKSMINTIINTADTLDRLNESKLPAIVNKLTTDLDYASTVSVQEATLVYEMLNPYIDRDESFMDTFFENCNNEANPRYNAIIRECKTIKEEAYDNNYQNHEDRINICASLLGITEASEDDDKSSSKPVEKKDQKAIASLNDAKLAWQGVKSKLKGASAKEQEMSRDLDMEFNHMLKNISMAFGTDHRQEIITGEVNRSLSKIIKIGIGLAGIGVMAHSAILPVLGAITLFAKSKMTSTKEKKMIIDEIDIELQVIEREINRAEQSGSTKKYRQLLTIQKNMQRRRQEIMYGLAKHGTRIPIPSTVGLKSRE